MTETLAVLHADATYQVAMTCDADALALGASQMKLLQTTEELTLYILDQHEVLQAQEAENAALRARLDSLEVKMTKLLEKNRGGDQ